jgi:HNH endonuclease
VKKWPPPLQRFEERISPLEDCWIWDRPGIGGYGMLHVNGKQVYAHRWSYEFHIGPIPEGLQLDHLCRRRACVNPYHLEPVPAEVNKARGIKKNRNTGKTHCQNGHPFDAQNTYLTTAGFRKCRICLAAWARSRRAQRHGS